jgi:hypothetical protein
MLEGLDRVDWARLTHAYGAASDTPDHIRRLASSRASQRKAARGALYSTIFHQGTRYAATAAAVPFLFELLDDPGTPEKGEIVRLLVHLAVGYPERFLPLGIDPAAAEFKDADAVAREEGVQRNLSPRLTLLDYNLDAVVTPPEAPRIHVRNTAGSSRKPADRRAVEEGWR